MSDQKIDACEGELHRLLAEYKRMPFAAPVLLAEVERLRRAHEEVALERDAAVEACDANWVTHQQVVAMRVERDALKAEVERIANDVVVALVKERGALEAEVRKLKAFFDMAAKVECEGRCGKFQPVLQDSECGQRTRNGEWLCPPCHSEACGLDVTLDENRWHGCKALRD